MNPVEHLFQGLVGYPIDWDATGTWMGAVATAIAVFLAAMVSDRSARRAAKAMRKQRYRALAALCIHAAELIDEVGQTACPGKGGIRATLPPADQFGDLLAALGSFPVFELGNETAVTHLFQVKRVLIENAALVVGGTQGEDWFDEAVRQSTAHDAKLCRKVAEAGGVAAKTGWWPKPIGNRWIVLVED